MVTMTETAAKKVSELRLEEGKPEWRLRIRVVGGGCSGMSYELGWEDQETAGDNIMEAGQGIRVYIDRQRATYLAGGEIDSVHNPRLGAGFAIPNPTVQASRGGGPSLSPGVVRNETGGRPVKSLEYEAYAPMAEAKMREIGGDVRQRWPSVKRVAMQHRIGRLEIGESSVLIAVSAAHRQEAFEACRYAIDTLKRTVPVWKKEHFEDGEVWVGLQGG